MRLIKLTCLLSVLANGLLFCSDYSGRAVAQDDDIRFVVRAGGPLGRIKQLKFASDSMQLLAGGYDKRLFVWNLVRDGKSHRLLRTTRSDSIFWGLSRDRRGLVETFDVSNASSRLAVAGSSLRYDYGDISIIQPHPMQVMSVLPGKRVIAVKNDAGHRATVRSVVFSPNGKRLASIDISGRLFVWDVAMGIAIAEHQGQPTFLPDRPQVLAFVDNETLVFVQESGKGTRKTSEIMQLDLRQERPAPVNLSQGRYGLVWTLAAADDGSRWVSSDLQENLYFWENGNFVDKRSLNGVAMSTAFGPGQLLLLNLVRKAKKTPETAKYSAPVQTELEIWDWQKMKPKHDADGVTVGGPAASVMQVGLTAAISTNIEGLLVAGVDDLNNAVHVFEVDEEGRFRRTPDDNKPVEHVLKGNADAPESVRFSRENPLRVEIARVGAPPRVISLKESRLEKTPPQGITWLDDPAVVDGWSMELSGDPAGNVVQVSKDGARQFDLSLDPILQGVYATHSWLTDRRGRVYAVAIGTRTNSIFVYSTHPQSNGQMLRYFRDHAGAIRDLSVSADGRFLASASDDATVKVWSLKGLQERPANFREKSAWGAVFQLQNNADRLVVSQVLEGGIAASRGLKNGDTVTQFEKTFGNDLRTATRTQAYSDPQAMLQAIRETILFDQVTFEISRQDEKGQEQKLKRPLVPGWEPVATIFIDNDQEWAIWTPRGYYNSSLHGDQLFGWLVNPKDRTGTPRYFSAKQVRKEFDQPDVLRNLFADAQAPPPPPIPAVTKPVPGELVREQLGRVFEKVPVVQIIAPANQAVIDVAGPVSIVAEVSFSDDREKYNVYATLNGGIAPDPKERLINRGKHEFRWEVNPVDGANRFHVRVLRNDQSPGTAIHQDGLVTFHARQQTTPNRLPFMQLVGIASGNSQEGPLMFAHKDVEDIIAAFKSGADKERFELRRELMLIDEIGKSTRNVTPDTVKGHIEKLKSDLKHAQPDDLLVVVIAGHGFVGEDGQYYFATADDFIPWSELMEVQNSIVVLTGFLLLTLTVSITSSVLVYGLK